MAYNKPSPWLLSLSFALFNISQSYDLKHMTNNGLLFWCFISTVNQICFARQSTETSSSLSSDNESSLSWPKAGKTATAFALAAFSLFCFRNISIRSDMVLSVQTKQNFVNHTASTMMVFCNEQQLWQQGYYYQQDHVMAFKQANSVSTTTTTTKEVENQSKYPISCFKTHETSRSRRNKISFYLCSNCSRCSLSSAASYCTQEVQIVNRKNMAWTITPCLTKNRSGEQIVLLHTSSASCRKSTSCKSSRMVFWNSFHSSLQQPKPPVVG